MSLKKYVLGLTQLRDWFLRNPLLTFNSTAKLIFLTIYLRVLNNHFYSKRNDIKSSSHGAF